MVKVDGEEVAAMKMEGTLGSGLLVATSLLSSLLLSLIMAGVLGVVEVVLGPVVGALGTVFVLLIVLSLPSDGLYGADRNSKESSLESADKKDT